MKAAIYCRVSTDDQGREGTSLQTQMEACQGYCNQKGYQIAKRFRETYSGLAIERPKLDELRKMIRANEIDVMVVYCLDRLSRDPTHGVILTQEQEKYNVKLEAVTETVESTDLGKLISYIRGFASKLEAEKIRERTMLGKQARLKEGRLPQGTGLGLYGYSWNKESGKRIIIEEEARVVTRIFTMVLQGCSFHGIAVELNKDFIGTRSGSKWHPLTVRRIATNEAYTGKTYFGKTKRIGKRVKPQPEEKWILLSEVTPPIITEEMFDKVQQIIHEARQSRPTSRNSNYILTGFMKCSKCGSSIGGSTLHGKYRYYKCRGAKPTTTRGAICDAGYIKADELEIAVLKRIHELISSPLFHITALTDQGLMSPNNEQDDISPILDNDIEKLRKKLKTYPAKEKNLYDLLAHQNVTKEYVLEAVDNLKKEKAASESRLKELIYQRNQLTNYSQPPKIKLSKFCDKMLTLIEPDSELLKSPEVYPPLFEKINLEVKADPSDFELKFRMGMQLVTTSEDNAFVEDYFKKSLIEFEQKHPEYYADDIALADRLPDDTVFGRVVNQVAKEFSPIERTSALRRECNYPRQPA